MPAGASRPPSGGSRWFEDQGLVERYPRVASPSRRADGGAAQRRPEAERWAAAAERGKEAAGPDSSLDGSLALLRTLLCRGGMAGMRADAAATWRPTWP